MEQQAWVKMTPAEIEYVELEQLDAAGAPIPASYVRLNYDVPLIEQKGPTCWAAAMAMILSYRFDQSIDWRSLLDFVRDRSPLPAWLQARLPAVLTGPAISVNADGAVGSGEARLLVKRYFGFLSVPLPNTGKHLYTLPFHAFQAPLWVPTARQWYDMLVRYGPLWVVINIDPQGGIGYEHAVVVTGIVGDVQATPPSPVEPSLFVNNPWGQRQIFTVANFNRQFGLSIQVDAEWRIWYHPPLLPESTQPESRDAGEALPEWSPS